MPAINETKARDVARQIQAASIQQVQNFAQKTSDDAILKIYQAGYDQGFADASSKHEKPND